MLIKSKVYTDDEKYILNLRFKKILLLKCLSCLRYYFYNVKFRKKISSFFSSA